VRSAWAGAWRAELAKVTTVRGQWISGVLAGLALPLTSLIVVATDGLGTRDTITSGAATGSVVALLAFGAWAATVAAGEYARGTMWVSLATVPRRPMLYGAKLAATSAIAAIGGLASVVVSFLVVWATSPPGDHDLGNPARLAGVVLAIVCVSAVGAAVGILTRSPTSATAIVVVAVLFPKAVGGLLGGLEGAVVGSSPGTVITQIVGGAQLPEDQMHPWGAGGAAVTMVLITAAVAAAAALAFDRRDG
jgi:ABC-2 type transport system permease protein